MTDHSFSKFHNYFCRQALNKENLGVVLATRFFLLLSQRHWSLRFVLDRYFRLEGNNLRNIEGLMLFSVGWHHLVSVPGGGAIRKRPKSQTEVANKKTTV